ncbi:N-acetylglutamate synthase, CG3035 family [Gordonia sp. DT30]|uniref:N-acetylglutamate synthase, CG3035 family n=1 Tax=unclassified Gordonia (in: high G+C Gram-positive bacteria) TaxID=2657482 RepID=UPI003CF7A176
MTGPGSDLGAYRGDRIVVRYRLGDAAPGDWRDAPNPRSATPGGPTQSDVTGHLLDDGDPVRVERDGTVESIPRAAISSIRLLSAVPVRNSEIRALEYAAALAWPGIEHEWIDGWLVRAGGGISRRANSAIALDRSPRTDATTLSAIESWYRTRHLPPLIAAPERLLPSRLAGTPASGENHVLTRELAARRSVRADADVVLAPGPTTEWVRAYLGPDADVDAGSAVVSASAGTDSTVTFATVESAGRPVAIGRGALTSAPDSPTRWLGITAVWTDPGRRRERLGDAVLATLLAWGAEAGASRAYLQVAADNGVAGNWYRARGFTLHHRYRYLSRERPR